MLIFTWTTALSLMRHGFLALNPSRCQKPAPPVTRDCSCNTETSTRIVLLVQGTLCFPLHLCMLAILKDPRAIWMSSCQVEHTRITTLPCLLWREP